MTTTNNPSIKPLRANRLAGLFQPAIVDIFAGCGGWSIGEEQAFVEAGYADRYIDLMINHWDTAVGVHQVNHPLTVHLHANVLEVDPANVLPGRQLLHLHASPDCTDHSKAKGGKPRLLAIQLTEYHGHNNKSNEIRGQDARDPLKTLDTNNRFGVVAAHVVKFRGDSIGHAVNEPMPTVTSGAGAARDAGAAHAMGVACAYLSHMYTSNTCGGQGDPRKPLKTVTSGGQHANACVVYLSPYYGNSKDAESAGSPMQTVVGKDRFGLSVVETNRHWILTPKSLKRARQVATWAKRMLGKKVHKHLIAVQDKAGKVFHLLTLTVDGAIHLVTDILMRMLRPRELARAQGFPDSYVIDRTADGRPVSKADQVKLIGNSVPPAFAKAIVKANIIDQGLLEDMPVLAGGVA